MANPQIEDGYTKLSNEILEHLIKTHLPPNEWQVLLCIIRKTYGFHKKVDHIANSQMVETTGLCKAVISRAVHKLTSKHMIIRNGKFIGFQKDWTLWGEATKVSNSANNEKLAILHEELAESSTKVSSPRVTQKIKETIQKKVLQKQENEISKIVDDLIKKERYNMDDAVITAMSIMSVPF